MHSGFTGKIIPIFYVLQDAFPAFRPKIVGLLSCNCQ
jgi:hypothetical protein